MHVGVNALYLRPGEVGGSETYLREALRAIGELGTSHRLTLFTNAHAAPTFDADRVTVRVVPGAERSRAARIAAEQTRLPRIARAEGVDVVWNAGFTAPALAPCPQVTTVYDLQHVRRPEHFRASHRVAWRALVTLAVRRSHRVLTLSEASRRDLLAHYALPADAVWTTPLGAAPDFFEAVDDAERRRVRERYGLAGPFVLTVSTTHPHKGYEDLIAAFAAVRDRAAEPPALVSAGPRGFAHRAIEAAARRAECGGALRLLGWVPRDDLRALYAEASVLAYPSTFEGFGLPIAEALAAGTPVVTTPVADWGAAASEGLRVVPFGDRGALAQALLEAMGERVAPTGPRDRWIACAERTLKALEAAAAAR